MFDLTPDRIQSDDVTIAGGNAFYLTPDAKRQEIQSLAEKGLLGDIANDPIAKRKFFDMLELGDIEELYDSFLKDIDYTRWENKLFRQGMIQETDPSILQEIEMQNQQAYMAWQQEVANFEQRRVEWQSADQTFKKAYGDKKRPPSSSDRWSGKAPTNSLKRLTVSIKALRRQPGTNSRIFRRK